MKPIYKSHRPLLLAGIRRYHTFIESEAGIPKQWESFNKLPEIPNQVPGVTYGAICMADEAGMEYMCAIEVTSFDNLSSELGRMRVHEQNYAFFTHEGPIWGIRKTWDYIMSEWLPASGIKPANALDFERYDDRYDALAGEGVVEIWFPVERDEVEVI